jgi:hypothetical protein
MKRITIYYHSDILRLTIVLSGNILSNYILPLTIFFFLDFNEFCFEDNDSGYTWEKTPVDVSVIQYCPTGKIGTVC